MCPLSDASGMLRRGRLASRRALAWMYQSVSHGPARWVELPAAGRAYCLFFPIFERDLCVVWATRWSYSV